MDNTVGIAQQRHRVDWHGRSRQRRLTKHVAQREVEYVPNMLRMLWAGSAASGCKQFHSGSRLCTSAARSRSLLCAGGPPGLLLCVKGFRLLLCNKGPTLLYLCAGGPHRLLLCVKGTRLLLCDKGP